MQSDFLEKKIAKCLCFLFHSAMKKVFLSVFVLKPWIQHKNKRMWLPWDLRCMWQSESINKYILYVSNIFSLKINMELFLPQARCGVMVLPLVAGLFQCFTHPDEQLEGTSYLLVSVCLSLRGRIHRLGQLSTVRVLEIGRAKLLPWLPKGRLLQCTLRNCICF